MSNIMHVRLRCDLHAWDKFKKFLESQEVKLAAYCYEAPCSDAKENPHYHAYLTLTKSSLDALKRARTRYFEKEPTMKGNGVASLQKMDQPEEYKEYMCKGVKAYKDKRTGIYRGRSQFDVVVIDTEIFNKSPAQYHESFWLRHESDTPRKYKNFTEKLLKDWEACHLDKNEQPYLSNQNNREILPLAYDELERKEIPFDDVLQLDIETHCVDWLIDYMGTENKPWDKWMLQKYVNLIFWKYKEHFASRSYIRARKTMKENILTELGFAPRDNNF